MERIDLSFFTARPSLIGGALCALLLLICPIVGRFKNDPAYYKIFLTCTPLLTAYMLLYALPLEAVAQVGLSSAVEMEIADDFFGPTRGVILPIVTIPTLIVAAVYSLWRIVKRYHDRCQRRSKEQFHRGRPLISQRHKHIDDNPYQTISESGTTYV